jgi:hypothetical protein
VRQVRPLIEEIGKILSETNGIIRGLDPEIRIKGKSKHRSATQEATPEELQLADRLKELRVLWRGHSRKPKGSLRACRMPRRSSTPFGASLASLVPARC